MDKEILQLMLGFAVLLLLSVCASKTSSKYGIPILLIFIVIGMLSGSDGPGGIPFESPRTAHLLGTISLIFILYSGGLSTQIEIVKPVWKEGLLLSSLGVLISAGIMAFIIQGIMGWNWIPSALLAATISSTDAAAVFGILKTRHLGLKNKIQGLIELESGSNDPMAVFLTLSLIQIFIMPENFSWAQLGVNFFIQMSLGAMAGWIMGEGLVKLINWLDLEFEGLYPVLTIAGVLAIYSLTEYCGGNGFLSVYLAGLTMGHEKFFSKKTLTVFHDGLAWLMQVAMFLALGLLVFPSQIPPIMGTGLLLALGLMFIARPLSTFICLWPFHYSWREILFVSWGGLRGAVPIILATYLLVNKMPAAHMMFNIVFFIVIASMLVQGTSLNILARWLGVQEKIKPRKRLPFKSRTSNRDFIEFEVGKSSTLIGQTILELSLPPNVLVVLIHRQDQDFIPRGNTQIEPYDRLICLVNKEVIPELERVLKPQHPLHVIHEY